MDPILLDVSKMSSGTPEQNRHLLTVQSTLDNILLLPLNNIVKHLNLHRCELLIAVELALHQVDRDKIINIVLWLLSLQIVCCLLVSYPQLCFERVASLLRLVEQPTQINQLVAHKFKIILLELLVLHQLINLPLLLFDNFIFLSTNLIGLCDLDVAAIEA